MNPPTPDMAALINDLLPTNQRTYISDPTPWLLSTLNTVLAPHGVKVHADRIRGGAGGGPAGAVWHIYATALREEPPRC